MSDSALGDRLVPQLPGQTSEPIADLPNPELNPLLNPILGRHLGRWAHVYFTTAPEKREEALYQLLAELQAEEGQAGPAVPVEQTQASGTENDGASPSYSLICAQCQRTNVRPQRYCGMCGAPMPLQAHAAAATTGTISAFGEFGSAPSDVASFTTEDPIAQTDALAAPAVTEDRWTKFSSGPTSLLFQAEPETESNTTPIAPPSQDRPVDVDWLRARNHAERRPQPRNRFLVVALLISTVCAGSWLYLRSRATPEEPTVPPAAQVKPPETTLAPNPSSAVVPGNMNDAASTIESPTQQAASTGTTSNGPTRNETPAAQSLVSRPVSTGPTTPQEIAQEGAAELALAKQKLAERNPSRTAVAAQLLWKAVGKQNSEALLLLSSLYERGEGVPKSCDQARLLLEAAARKGVPEAHERLRSLGSCQ